MGLSNGVHYVQWSWLLYVKSWRSVAYFDSPKWIYDLYRSLTINFENVVPNKESITCFTELGKYNKRDRVTLTNIGNKGWKKSFYTQFATPHPCAMLTKYFHLTHVCISSFSNIERGIVSADTYSVGITVMISCFWHFPTQFVPDCKFLDTIIFHPWNKKCQLTCLKM